MKGINNFRKKAREISNEVRRKFPTSERPKQEHKQWLELAKEIFGNVTVKKQKRDYSQGAYSDDLEAQKEMNKTSIYNVCVGSEVIYTYYESDKGIYLTTLA